jgi:hypothetical protein
MSTSEPHRDPQQEARSRSSTRPSFGTPQDPQRLKGLVIELPAVVVPHATILPDHKIKVGLLSNFLVTPSGHPQCPITEFAP